MLSSFEAIIVNIANWRPQSRYDIMKFVRDRSMYWAGSSGAVYTAIDRLEKKGILKTISDEQPIIYGATDVGVAALLKFFKTPIVAQKIILDPATLINKIAGVDYLSQAEKVEFLAVQLDEIKLAKEILIEKQDLEEGIVHDLGVIAIAKLDMDEVYVAKLLEKFRAG